MVVRLVNSYPVDGTPMGRRNTGVTGVIDVTVDVKRDRMNVRAH
jgi:hypothetical protein